DTSRQMERMFTTLLTLARSQRGELNVSREQVNLVELLRKLEGQNADLLSEKSISCDWRLPANAVVQTDLAMAKSIFINLIDNAVEHTAPRGDIQVQLAETPEAFVLRITNSNSTLQPKDLDHLFEPLWRKDGARSERTHAGLGLALVQVLAEQLGWSVHPELPRADLFSMTIRIPKTPLLDCSSVRLA
ncbi:MAG TPA: HAMP domain-containing sensor histidine kinase, partial [Clostridia bacterium]|nr:HAMP domain-containing sensor histidine kinase [Clostridia bacterium]